MGAGNPGRFAATSWWRTQSGQTGLHDDFSRVTGRKTGLLGGVGARKCPEEAGVPGGWGGLRDGKAASGTGGKFKKQGANELRGVDPKECCLDQLATVG